MSNAVGEGRALDQFENECPLPLGFFQPIDVPDVVMIQSGEAFGFTFKASETIRVVGEGLGQDFQGHVPVQPAGVSGSQARL